MDTKPFSIILFFILTSITFPAVAQDLIILKTGDEIQAIVNEISIDVIKYKKFDNQSGPIYLIEKSKVFMVKYANGTKDVFNAQPESQADQTTEKEALPPELEPPILEYKNGIKMNNKLLSDSEIRSVFSNYPVPLEYYNKGEGFKLVGSALQWSVIGAGIYVAIKGKQLDPPESEELAKKGLIAMGGLAAGWIAFNITGNSKVRKSVEVYNAEIIKPTTYNFNFIIRDNQLGLAMKF